MSRWKARLPNYYRENRARRRRPSDATEWFEPVPDGHGDVVLIPMNAGHQRMMMSHSGVLETPGDLPCKSKKDGCRCTVAWRMVARMDAICGDKGDDLETLSLRSARCRQEGRVNAAASRRAVEFPEWWWEIRGLILAVRKRLEPIRKDEGQMIGYGARGLDYDSGGYGPIALRALEDCR